MGVVVRLPSGRYRLFLKDTSEILTKKRARHVIVSKNPGHSQHTDSAIEAMALDEITRDNISQIIAFYANQMSRTITLCYRDFENWPPAGTKFHSADEVPYEDLSCDMTLVAITGIEDPLRVGVHEAVATCHHVGVTVKTCVPETTSSPLARLPLSAVSMPLEASSRKALSSVLLTHKSESRPSLGSRSWRGLPPKISPCWNSSLSWRDCRRYGRRHERRSRTQNHQCRAPYEHCRY